MEGAAEDLDAQCELLIVSRGEPWNSPTEG